MDEVKKKSLLSVREEELMNYLWRYDATVWWCRGLADKRGAIIFLSY